MKIDYRKILILGVLSALFININAAKKHGFAIVIDTKTYQTIKADVDNYANAVEKYEGLKTYTIVDKWGVPDSIRATLIKLYQQKDNPIEGAVFIGDIPIAMVKDAQHLTSAFKMSQTQFDKKESSVPTDRFYDDFGLKFKYLEKDEDEPLYHYYTLVADGDQILQPDIYSGRIKANDDWGTTRYQKIAAYLKKVVAEKQKNNIIDQILFFSGHGYVSESLGARIDEKVALLESFPWLKGQQNGVEYIDHSRDKSIKTRVKNEMQRKDMDLAILHHHGDAEIEYMNGLPNPKSIMERYEQLKQYCRENLRYAKEKGKDLERVKNNLREMFGGIPDTWFEGTFDSIQIVKDSIFDESMDQYYYEYENYHPNCRMVIMDACYNGSFHKDKYIGGGYIFNSGNTMVTIGNSVNVLQDKWSDRYIGAAALGMRIGFMVQMNPFLEQHLIGDPTYHFTTAKDLGYDINEAIMTQPLSFWKKQLKSKYVGLRALALRKISDLDPENASDILFNQFKNSFSFVERMEAMVLLSTYNDDNFIKCLKLALNDSYEMTQRFAVNFTAKSGHNDLIPELIQVASRNNTTERIEFDTEAALAIMPKAKLLDEFEKNYKKLTYYVDQQGTHDIIKHAVETLADRWSTQMEKLFSDTIQIKTKRSIVRLLRNNNKHEDVTELLNLVQTCNDDTLKVNLWEALGWFNLSYRHNEIAEVAKKVSENTSESEIVRYEALKTYNRLTATEKKKKNK